MGNTSMKRSPGECFMCKTVLEVRYFDLYVIGSEGCHLCLPCELQVVEMVRQAAGQALQKKKQEFLAAKRPGFNLDGIDIITGKVVRCDSLQQIEG